MAPAYEILIPSHPKDHSKLPFVIARALQYTDAKHIHVVVPDPGVPIIKGLASANVTIHADVDVIPFDASKIKHRPNWVYQQFIKLFQQITGTDWYLTFCSDLFLNKPYPVFNGNQPLMVLGRSPFHIIKPYIEFNLQMLNDGYMAPFNFVSDGPLYCISLVEELLTANGYTRQSFMEKAAAISSPKCIIGDPEFYAAWVFNRRPGFYGTAKVLNAMYGKYESGTYTTAEIVETLGRHVGDIMCDTISMHSWGP